MRVPEPTPPTPRSERTAKLLSETTGDLRRRHARGMYVLEACGTEPVPDGSVEDVCDACGHRRGSHNFNDDGVPMAFGGSCCDDCWDCPRYRHE